MPGKEEFWRAIKGRHKRVDQFSDGVSRPGNVKGIGLSVRTGPEREIQFEI
jgi:hypothetical protein